MEQVQLTLKSNGEGLFHIMEGGAEIAKMEISVRGDLLTVYHTEVSEKSRRQRLRKRIISSNGCVCKNKQTQSGSALLLCSPPATAAS